MKAASEWMVHLILKSPNLKEIHITSAHVSLLRNSDTTTSRYKRRERLQIIVPLWAIVSQYHIQFSSVTQSCPTLCNPMDCSMPGFPVHHQLPELTQNSWPSSWWCHPTSSSSVILPSVFPSIRVFSNESVLHIRWPKYWSFSFRSVLPMNIQDWFPLGWTSWISLLYKRLSRVLSQHHSSKASILQRSAFFVVQLPHPCEPYQYWENWDIELISNMAKVTQHNKKIFFKVKKWAFRIWCLCS